MFILIGYVASLALAAASLAWWQHIVRFNMRLLHGYDRWQDKEVPRGLVINRYWGTAFLASMSLAVFVSSSVAVVQLVLRPLMPR